MAQTSKSPDLFADTRNMVAPITPPPPRSGGEPQDALAEPFNRDFAIIQTDFHSDKLPP
jgi:hypothetical protein